MRKAKIIIICICVVILLLIVLFIVATKYCTAQNEKEQEMKENITKRGDKQVLILYQESVGSTVTDSVAKIRDDLVSKDYSVTENHPRSDLNYDINKYDLIVFISPIYAKHFAKPMEEYIKANDFSGSKVFVLLTGMMDDKGEVGKVTKLFTKTKALQIVKDTKATDSVVNQIKGMMKQ